MQSNVESAPVWLVRSTMGSVGLALLSLAVLLWAKWGVVLTMAQDVIKFCF